MQSVEFCESTEEVMVTFDEEEVFDELEDDSDAAIAAYLQEYFGVGWELQHHSYLPSGWYHAEFER